MHRQSHPEPEQLDRLRAGLLDDLPGEKATLLQHLAACSGCREHYESWAQFGAGLADRQLAADRLKQDLQHARNRALTGQRHNTRHARGLVPYATAALLLVAVSVGLWTLGTDIAPEALHTAQTSEAVPDIYEDLDFYLWLSGQEDSGADEEQLNPSKT